MNIKDFVTWPVAAVVLGAITAFVVIMIFAPPGVRDYLLGANGLVTTLISAYMRSPQDHKRMSSRPPPFSTETTRP